MTLLEQILNFLNGQMNRPVPYQSLALSWFHYLALAIVVVASVVAVIRMKNASSFKLRRFLLVFAGLLLFFELYKQLIFSYQADWTYQWYIFPFQFCSTPMYVGLLAGLTKNKKLQQILINFLGTYGLFAGLAAMVYPSDVFVNTIGINIQTMVHHGSMTVVGVALLANKVQRTPKAIIGATGVFSVLVAIAILLNYVHNTWIATGTFNMFFINPNFHNHLPVLAQIEPLVPHPVFVFIYIIGFAFLATLVLFFEIGIKAIGYKKRSVQPKSQEAVLYEDHFFRTYAEDSQATVDFLYMCVIR